MKDLYRSENVVVRCVPTSDRSRWVVTFDNYGIGHGFDRPGFGETFLRSNGISAIHVMGRREDWYQYPEMADAMAAVREIVGGSDRVVTYGSSMGGYAALRFADAVGAGGVLALSPQYSIDPEKAPHEDRWPQDSHRISWLPEIDGVIVCGCRPVVVYDPKGPDGAQARRIAKDIEVTEIRLPNTGHPVTTFLGEIGLLAPLLFDVLADSVDAEDRQRQAWGLRRDSVLYLSELANLQRPHRPRLGLAMARRAAAVSPDSAYAASTLARHLSFAGEHAEAVALHRKAVEATARTPTFLIPYADALMAAGDPASARKIAREAVKALPYLAHLWGWAAHIFWTAGHHDEARQAAMTASSIQPSSQFFARLVTNYRHSSPDPATGGLKPTLWLKAIRWWKRRRSRLIETPPDHKADVISGT